MSNDDQWRGQVDHRLTALETEMKETREDRIELRRLLRENTAVTEAVKSDTSQLIQLFKASKVGVRFMAWAVGIAAAVATIWSTWRGPH